MAGCINCFNKCFDNSFFKWVMASCCVEFIKRIIPLLQSIWMHGDFTLDVLQTFTYYEHAFENGTYSEWALNRTKTTNATLETVHPGYFYTSIVVWVLPPFLYSALFFLSGIFDDEFDPFVNANELFGEFSSIKIPPPSKSKISNIIVYLVLFPVNLIVSLIFIYILIPFMAFKSALIVAWTGENDPERRITKGFNAEHVPALKLFEQLDEAIPQAIMSVVFLCNNFNFLIDHDTLIPNVPTTLISFIFSLGSIIMGLYSGYNAFLSLFIGD